jgi:hypothetical protein
VSIARQLLYWKPAVHTEESTSEKAKYPSPPTDRDTSVRHSHLEQRLFIKISQRDGLQCKRLHLNLVELYGDDALSYSEVRYWSRQFLIDWEYVEDARRTG